MNIQIIQWKLMKKIMKKTKNQKKKIIIIIKTKKFRAYT